MHNCCGYYTVCTVCCGSGRVTRQHNPWTFTSCNCCNPCNCRTTQTCTSCWGTGRIWVATPFHQHQPHWRPQPFQSRPVYEGSGRLVPIRKAS